MITTDKVTEIFYILDEFCKNLDAELTKNLHIAPIDEGYKRMRNRKGQMSKSEIMTILLCYHFYGKYLPIRATSSKSSLRTSSTKVSISFMGSNQT